MFTENEVVIMLENEEIQSTIKDLKDEFKSKEAQFLDISDHDFLSLILLTPSVGVALADDSVSLFEELALNKKARKLSKGGYFLKKDPVANAMQYLIKHYDDWNEKFVELLKKIMDIAVDIESVRAMSDDGTEVTPNSFRKEVLKAPYGFVRFMASFFCKEDDDVLNVERRSINQTDYERMIEVGKQLGWDDIPLFKHFCATYTIK